MSGDHSPGGHSAAIARRADRKRKGRELAAGPTQGVFDRNDGASMAAGTDWLGFGLASCRLNSSEWRPSTVATVIREMCAASNAAAELVHVAAIASLASKWTAARRTVIRDEATERPRIEARSNRRRWRAGRDGRR